MGSCLGPYGDPRGEGVTPMSEVPYLAPDAPGPQLSGPHTGHVQQVALTRSTLYYQHGLTPRMPPHRGYVCV